MGYKIKVYRDKLRMSQEELAKKSGVSRQTISGLENDSDKCVSSRTLQKLASALGTTVKSLFFENTV